MSGTIIQQYTITPQENEVLQTIILKYKVRLITYSKTQALAWNEKDCVNGSYTVTANKYVCMEHT